MASVGHSAPWRRLLPAWPELLCAGCLAVCLGCAWWFSGRLTTSLQWLLGIGTAAALAMLLRRVSLQFFGPVLFYEMVRTGRRGRFILLRCAYALVLLLALWAVYLKYSDNLLALVSTPRPSFVMVPGTLTWVQIPPDPAELRAAKAAALARFAEAFFSAFMIVQLLAVMLLTPAYTAGAIAEEKDRRRLEFLLATDLSSREIVLGKLAACLANLTLLILTGLPILSLTQLLGGVDPSLLLAGFAATGLTMLSLAALSILNSVYARKPRDAIVLTYLAVIAYLMISVFSLVPLRALTAPPPLPPRIAYLAGVPAPPPVVEPFSVQAIKAFNSGNLFIVLAELREAWDTGTPLAAVLPELVWKYALFHGLAAFACTGWAVLRMRAVALRSPPLVARKRKRWFHVRHGLRPTPGRQPMLWKEIFAEPGLTFSWFGRAIVAVIVLVSFAPAVWIAGEFVWGYASGTRGYYGWDRLSETINIWVRLVGTTVATLTLIAVALRAASSVSGERDKQTIDSLLSTPLAPEAILYAKWIGSIVSVRWAWAWLALIWGVAALLGGLSAVTLPWLLLTWLVYAAFFAALGMRFSISSPTTLRATLGTLGTLAVLCFAHWLPRFFWQATPNYSFHDESWRWMLDFQAYGLTPPIALSWLSFHGDNLYDPIAVAGDFREANPWNIMSSIIIGMLCWGLAAYWLWKRNCRRFRESIDRMPWRLEKALDYRGRVKRESPGQSAALESRAASLTLPRAVR